MDTFVLEQQFARKYQAHLDQINATRQSRVSVLNRRGAFRWLEDQIEREIRPLVGEGDKLFVHVLDDPEEAKPDVEFIVTRVTPGRVVTHIHSSILAELSIHDATLPK